jgi:ABC-type multidrug transport system ATPase subunit
MVTLEACDLQKSLAGRRVLRTVSLQIEHGERVFVLGHNGSGKSTLLHVLSGILASDAGRVRCLGSVGFAPEKPDLPEHLLVAEWLDVVLSLKGAESYDPGLFAVDELLGKKLAALSLGQRQRVSLAAAWLAEPSLLILDEPTNGIDQATRAELEQRLLGTTAIIAMHDRGFASSLATRIVTLERGSLIPAS